MQFAQLPILGISGRSGAGKTTLILELIPHCKERNLKVAVVKLCGRPVALDQPGKDSDRFFRAGVDLFLESAEEEFSRKRLTKGDESGHSLARLAQRYDLILVEGCKDEQMSRLLLLAEGEEQPAHNDERVLGVLARGSRRTKTAKRLIDQWLDQLWTEQPIYGCVLIGGKSSRMGQPKHLLTTAGQTWLSRSVTLLQQVCDQVVVAGSGELPNNCPYPRLPDPPAAQGPLAGILAALRWHPGAAWLMTACDQPDMESGALHWLLNQRRPGIWGVMPVLSASGRAEPLLACYEGRLLPSIEEMNFFGQYRPSQLAKHPKVVLSEPPNHLKGAWRNVNTPEELQKI